MKATGHNSAQYMGQSMCEAKEENKTKPPCNMIKKIQSEADAIVEINKPILLNNKNIRASSFDGHDIHEVIAQKRMRFNRKEGSPK